MSASASFDWDRFVERALARELSLVASRAVAALASLGVKIPPEVPRRLTSEPPSVAERLADRAMRAVPTHLSVTVVGWDRYRRFRAHAPPGLRPSGPLDWLADAWQVSGPAGLLVEGGRRMLALNRSLSDRGNW